MKKYSCRKCGKGKISYRTASAFRSLAIKKNKAGKVGKKK